MSNTIESLRDHLFQTLAALRDKETPMDLDRAKTVCAVSQQIIDSARVEVEFVKVSGGRGTGFIPDAATPAALPNGQGNGAKPGILGVTRHKLAG